MLENKMLEKMLDMLIKNEVNQHRRNHLIECVRNMAFAYEKYEKLLSEQKVITKVMWILAEE